MFYSFALLQIEQMNSNLSISEPLCQWLQKFYIKQTKFRLVLTFSSNFAKGANKYISQNVKL